MDIITHCTDTDALMSELKENYPTLINTETEDNPVFCVDKTPTVRNGNETLSLIRANDEIYEVLVGLNSIEILGTYGEVFADPEKKSICDRIYQREYKYIDENGVEQTGMKPEKFGVFA